MIGGDIIFPQTINERESKLKVFDEMESVVRAYCRSFPAVFTRARGYRLWDKEEQEYIDFFAGAGALNYGHNNPLLKEKLIDYIESDGITHGLDMATGAKENFIKRFNEVILKPRGMTYKIMFPGPTGTNAVESALKLARKVTERDLVMSFTNGFHGMTLGALSVTGNSFKRHGAGVALQNAVSMPFDGYMGEDFDTAEYLEQYLEDNGSGVSLPAAIILETVQGEGGINVAGFQWLKRIEQICRRYDILLIIDDIQVGCGRTGTFFSFEPAGVKPDIVCLSKSIGGYGLPMAINLIKPEYDIWEPGEHNGTFRGNNLAFITAAEALTYWEDIRLSEHVKQSGEIVNSHLERIAESYPEMEGEVRGRGMMQGISCGMEGLAEKICAGAFQNGLLVETAGVDGNVVKLLPPLTIDRAGINRGINILEESIDNILKGAKA